MMRTVERLDLQHWFEHLPSSNSSTQNNDTMTYYFNGSSFKTLAHAANTALIHWSERNCQCAIDFLKTHADAIDKEITISKENWPRFKAAHLQPKQLTFAQIAEQVKLAQTALEADKKELKAINNNLTKCYDTVSYYQSLISVLKADLEDMKSRENILRESIAKNEAILNKTV